MQISCEYDQSMLQTNMHKCNILDNPNWQEADQLAV